MAILVKDLTDFTPIRHVLLDVDRTVYSGLDMGYRLECFCRVFTASARQGFGLGLLNPINAYASGLSLLHGLHKEGVFPNSMVRGVVSHAMRRLTYQWITKDAHLMPVARGLREDFSDVSLSVFTSNYRERVMPVLNKTGLTPFLSSIADVRLRNPAQSKSLKQDDTIYDRLQKAGIVQANLNQVGLIDDSLSALEHAHRSGIRTIWVSPEFRRVADPVDSPSFVDAVVTTGAEGLCVVYDAKRYATAYRRD